MNNELLLQIKIELDRRKIKRFEFAEIMKITPSYLSDILNGKKDGTKAQDRIKSMIDYLDI